MIQYNPLRRRLERWSNFKIQVFIYCYQRGKFQQHLPHNFWESNVARIFLFCFSKICNIFLTKVQQSYFYSKLCNYREKFVPNCVCCNGWIIFSRLNTIKKIKNCLLFFIFNFTCCKYFALKENHYSKQTNHPQGFPHREIRISH